MKQRFGSMATMTKYLERGRTGLRSDPVFWVELLNPVALLLHETMIGSGKCCISVQFLQDE